MAFLFKSKPKGAQEVVKNLKESLAAFDKKDIKEKDLKKVRVHLVVSLIVLIARTVAGARGYRCRCCSDEVHSVRRLGAAC